MHGKKNHLDEVLRRFKDVPKRVLRPILSRIEPADFRETADEPDKSLLNN